MPATPADIQRFTNNGIVLTASNTATRDQDPNALDTGTTEREQFFDDPNHGQILLDELFGFLGLVGKPHEGIEIDDSLGLGTTVPISPKAPQAHIIDFRRRLNWTTAVRAYSFDMSTDAYALELVGLSPSDSV